MIRRSTSIDIDIDFVSISIDESFLVRLARLPLDIGTLAGTQITSEIYPLVIIIENRRILRKSDLSVRSEYLKIRNREQPIY